MHSKVPKTRENHIKKALPERLWKELHRMVDSYRSKGAYLFIFGSFARNEQVHTSDLDLGVEWEKESQKDVFLQLQKDILNLPTIRKIDLVNFDTADDDFKNFANKHKVYL